MVTQPVSLWRDSSTRAGQLFHGHRSLLSRGCASPIGVRLPLQDSLFGRCVEHCYGCTLPGQPVSQTALASPKVGNRGLAHLDRLLTGREGGVALLHHEDLLVWMPVQLRAASRRGVYHYERHTSLVAVSLEFARFLAARGVGQVDYVRRALLVGSLALLFWFVVHVVHLSRSPGRLRPSIFAASSLSPARVPAGNDVRCR